MWCCIHVWRGIVWGKHGGDGAGECPVPRLAFPCFPGNSLEHTRYGFGL